MLHRLVEWRLFQQPLLLQTEASGVSRRGLHIAGIPEPDFPESRDTQKKVWLEHGPWIPSISTFWGDPLC